MLNFSRTINLQVENFKVYNGRIRYLGEQLKDWVAQLLKALSSGIGLGEGIKVEKILI